jgi:hypothetical protein
VKPLPPRRLLQAWARSTAFTMALSLLVALGVGDEGLALSAVVLGVAGLGLGLLYRMFPKGLHFAFGTATGLALYATLFVVLGRAQFPAAADWSRPVAFLLPVGAFLGTVFSRRRELAEVAEKQEAESLDLLPYAARWLAGVSAVGAICFALPVNRLEPAAQAMALMAAMAVIGVVVAFSVRDVVRLLVDVALIMEELGQRARHLAVPIVAFLLMYAVLVIGFGATYRIADGMSHHALFHGPDGPMRLTYSDALHFSIATLSTVGYGDIRPADDGARVLASLEVLAGQLLLLFGFAEIMRSRRIRTEGPAPRARARDHHVDPDGAAGHSPPPPR